MAQITPDRVPNNPLIETDQGGNYPPEFDASIEKVITTQTGIPIGQAFTAANPPAGLLDSKLEQKSTQERISVQTAGSFTGLVLSSDKTDPVYGIVTETDTSIVPSFGGVYGVTVTAGGSGYDQSTVAATSPAPTGGISATYAVTVTAGAVTGIAVTNPGSGYAVAPAVTITGGSGATATALIPAYTATDYEGRYIDTTALNKWQSLQSAKSWPVPPINQDTFNYIINFAESNPSFPSFIRRYLIRRDQYDPVGSPLANGTAFTSVYEIKITAAGSGYSHPLVTITSGSGSGATAIALVNPANGSISRIIIVSEGTGYAAATATVADSGGGTGTGATLSVVLQRAACVLVKEETVESKEDWSPIFNLVIRYYKTLPGPARTSSKKMDDGTILVSTRTEKQVSTITATGEGITGSTWNRYSTENIPGFSYYADELHESRTIPGEIVETDRIDELDEFRITITRRMLDITTIQASIGESVNTGVWTRIYMEPLEGSNQIAILVTERRAATGGIVSEETRLDELDEVAITSTRQLLVVGSIVTAESTSGSNWVRKFSRAHMGSTLVALQIIETRLIVGTLVTLETRLDDLDQFPIVGTRQLLAVGSLVNAESVVSTNWIRKFSKEHMGSAIVGLQFIETRAATGGIVPEETKLDELDEVPIFGTRQLLPVGSIADNEAVDSTNWIRSFSREHMGSTAVALQIVQTRLKTGLVVTMEVRLDELDEFPITGTRQLLPVGSLLNAESVAGGNWIRKFNREHEGSAYVGMQFIETRPATGGVVPIQTRLNTDGTSTNGTQQLLVVGSIVTSEAVVSTNFVRKFSREHMGSTVIALQVIETRVATGTTINETNIDSDSKVLTDATTQKPVGSITSEESYDSGSSTWIKTTKKKLDSAVVADESVVTRDLPGNLLTTKMTDPQSGIVTVLQKQLVPSGSVTAGITGAGVITLSIVNGGTGWTGTPTIVISGGGGTGATATATVTTPSPAGKLSSVTITSGGAGYTIPPTVAITDGGGGTGATAIALLSPSPVNSITVTTAGSYASVPIATITDNNGGIGAGATATVLLGSTSIATLTITATGSGYSSATITIGPPDDPTGGTQATADAVIAGMAITGYSLTNAGTGYINPPTVSIAGDGTGATATAQLSDKPIAAFQITNTGFNYQSPTVALSSGSGAGTVHTASASVAQVVLTAPGTSYVTPVVAFSGSDGVGAAATANIATATITALTLTAAGSGYTTTPTVATSGGGGTGAILLAGLGSLTYVNAESVSAIADLASWTTVDISTFPPSRNFPVSARIKRSDINISGLVVNAVVNTNSQGTYTETAVGLARNTIEGGNGPVLAHVTEVYMTDTQYAAYVPAAFSISGRAQTTSMVYEVVDGPAGFGQPKVWSFPIQGIQQGTSAGVFDINYVKLNHGIRFVRIITIPINY